MLPERVSVEASEPKEFTPYLHFQHTLEGCSLLYELMKTRNPIEAPPIITPIDAFNTLSGLHSFGVYPVGGRQSQHARKSGPPTEEAKPPKNEKGGKLRHVLGGIIGGLPASRCSPFLPSLILNLSAFSIST